tara:strand:- start:2807 stop:3085 length:279 start_codon:yes stop_codon:yes gene_type:complete
MANDSEWAPSLGEGTCPLCGGHHLTDLRKHKASLSNEYLREKSYHHPDEKNRVACENCGAISVRKTGKLAGGLSGVITDEEAETQEAYGRDE